MKKYRNRLLFFVVAAAIAVSSCSNRTGKGKIKMETKPDPAAVKADSAPKVLYTCPMHHQIRSGKPGKCPICGMTLVPVENSTAKQAGDTTARLTIPPRQQFLAGIHTDTARMAALSGQLTLTGVTLFDPGQTRTLSAWVDGWIEKMYVRNPGEMVRRGQKLYDLYSPELLATERDYQLALRQKGVFQKASVDLTATIQALRQKLERWGLSGGQLKELETQTTPSGKVTIYSKSSGYLTQKMKEEGDHISEGDAVMDIAGNNTLWVQAQLYDSELPLLREHPRIGVQVDGFPGQNTSGNIVFENPVNDKDSRVHLLNISIRNPGGKIQPGMPAYVYLQTGEGHPVVVIPKSSVIYGQDADYVWVKRPDSAFQRRKVRLGEDNATLVAVLNGVKAGEPVVSSGAYLLNSAYVLRYGSGANLSGMQMSDMRMKGRSQ